MKTIEFSPKIRGLFHKDRKRRQALIEIESSLSKLIRTHTAGWEAEVDLQIPKVDQAVLEGPEPERSNLIIERTNGNMRTLTLLGALKAIDLTDALIRAANQKSFAACAIISRSLLELAAALCYAHEELRPYWSKNLLTAEEFEEVRIILRRFTYGGHYDWEKDPEKTLTERRWKRPRQERLPEAARLMKKLDEWCRAKGFSRSPGAVERLYSGLSDFVHPTSASALLYSARKAGVYRLRQTDPEFLEFLVDLTLLPTSISLRVIEAKLGASWQWRGHTRLS